MKKQFTSEIKSLVSQIFLGENLSQLYSSIYNQVDEYVKMKNIERRKDNSNYSKIDNLEQVINIYRLLGGICYDWHHLNNNNEEEDFDKCLRIERIESNLVEICSILNN